MSESALQARMRKLALQMMETARGMEDVVRKTGNQQEQFGDIRDTMKQMGDCAFTMRRLAVLLIGYAPQPLPRISNDPVMRRSAFATFKDEAPLQFLLDPPQTHSLSESSADLSVDTLAPPLSDNAE